MSLEFRYDVTDREEIDGQRGLHGLLLFKDSEAGRSLSLEGAVTFSDEFEDGDVSLQTNELKLESDTAAELIEAACTAAWGDIYNHDLAVVGTHWRPLWPWLERHLGDRAGAISAEIVLLAKSARPVKEQTNAGRD